MSTGGQCTYCGSDLASYDPLYVQRERNGDRTGEGRFCNYACLATHVEEEGLVFGTACEFDPGDEECC